MALFKIYRGQEENLPSKINSGWCYYCWDTNRFYIDSDGGRKCINDIPTDLSDLLSDSTHRTVTDAQIAKWNSSFAAVQVGSTVLEADDTNSTITFVAGTNVTISPDATADSVTFSAKDTTYTITKNDGHSFTLTPSTGDSTTITLDAETDTTYTIGVNGNEVTLTPINGSAQSITVPYATNASHATTADSATDADTVTGHTVGIDVPSDAVFTDTVFSGSYNDLTDTPTLGTAADKDVASSGNASSTEVVMGNDTRLSDARPASDVSAWAKENTKPTYTATEVGAIDSTLKGANNGVAELDSTGKVPSSQLPSYVDDVLEYASASAFPATGETGKIYVDQSTNKTYRWGGTAYAEISPSIAIGETSSTAFRGDHGKVAYDHASAKGSAFASGLYKITTNGEGHVTAATAVEKSDITGLGIPGADTNTTYTLTQDSTDGHKITFTPSSGSATTITIPDNNTTYDAATQSVNGLMSAADKTKLDGIASGAQVNTVTGVKGGSESSYRTGNINITAANIGLGNVENKSSATIRGELTKSNVTTALGYTPPTQDTTYSNLDPEAGGTDVSLVTTGEKAIWNAKSNLTLGETSGTAYRGDRGKTAYDHSQATHARTDATAVAASTTNGNIKINGTETTVYTHPGSGTNPHGTTKSDVGLGNVGNFKAVSTVASQGLSSTEQANARANIGAGTSSFSGSYNDLSNKPTLFSGSYNDLSNKPTLGTAAAKDVASSGNASSTQVVMGNDSRLSDSRPASDVSSWAKASSKPTYTASEVGLGNVGNFKAVSTVASQGLSSTEQANARANIGAGTSSFSGSYSDLSNKPTLGTASSKDVASSGNASTSQVVMGNDTRLSDSRNAKDVYSWAKASTKPSYTASEVGAIATSAKGAASGVAELDSNGKVPSSQLPSYVDDVLEYNGTSSFPTTGETGKIYVDTSTNKTYRWGGSSYAEISPSLALGETSSTAYRGDRGKTAYDHSQSTHARTDATAVAASSTNGNIKINGTETTVYTHPGSGTNPHGTTKSDVGLGNVGNFKAVSTVASQGLSSTEQANARANIGAGTSSFSGSYNDLSNKPTIPSKTSQLTNDSGFITTDTNTHRPIQVNGTEVLGNNTTALNLKAGSNVSITDGGSGAITIAATDTKYTAATAAPGNIATSGSQGSSTNYARQDHTHGISLATGDSNGQVKIAGSNVSVKGLGSAAYTNSTAYAVNNELSSQNLNNVLAPGFYSAGGSNSVTNKPSDIDYFGLEVIHNAIGSYYTQIINNGSTFYRRNCINGTWSAWTQDKYTDTNTWRPVSDSVSSTSSSDAASSKAVKTAYDLAASKTANTGTVTQVSAGTGLTGGNITTSGTIALATSGVTAGSAGPTAAVTGNNGTTVAIPRITVDAYGRVTALTSYNLTNVNTDADTKNTAGSTDTSSKIFLVGATSQAANPQTYSDNEVYATNGVLTAKSMQVGGGAATIQYNATTKSIDFVFA